MPPVDAWGQRARAVLVRGRRQVGEGVDGVDHGTVGDRVVRQQVPVRNGDEGTGVGKRRAGYLPDRRGQEQRLARDERGVAVQRVQPRPSPGRDRLVLDGYAQQVRVRRLPQVLQPRPFHVGVREDPHACGPVEGVREDEPLGHHTRVPHGGGEFGAERIDGQQPGVYVPEQLLGGLPARTGLLQAGEVGGDQLGPAFLPHLTARVRQVGQGVLTAVPRVGGGERPQVCRLRDRQHRQGRVGRVLWCHPRDSTRRAHDVRTRALRGIRPHRPCPRCSATRETRGCRASLVEGVRRGGDRRRGVRRLRGVVLPRAPGGRAGSVPDVRARAGRALRSGHRNSAACGFGPVIGSNS